MQHPDKYLFCTGWYGWLQDNGQSWKILDKETQHQVNYKTLVYIVSQNQLGDWEFGNW